jgi:tetratricopeptide (TPR) repeat protein
MINQSSNTLVYLNPNGKDCLSFRYTRQSFLFQMLNKALLTKNISILHKFHFFIKDLHMYLEQLHSLYKPSLKSRVFNVYRGVRMPWQDFKTRICDEVTHLIAFDSFLSTSLEENVAINFAKDNRYPENESVVFCMEIDADQMERPFADISRWSEFKEEREVLFSIGTVFRIKSVADQKTSDDIWMVHLSTVSETDTVLQKETQQIQITLLKFFETVLDAQIKANNHQKLPACNANVASMLHKQGEYEDSLLFYKKALDALNKLESPDPQTKAMYISNVAKAQMALGRDDAALVLYKDALDIRDKECESNDPSLIQTFHTIGHIYRKRQNWNEALKQYTEALKRQLSPLDSRLLSDSSSIAFTYICIGIVFNEQAKYQDALESFLEALKQQKQHLSEQHPILAFLYNNIGAMYYKTKRYDLALENQLECLEIESKALPNDHKTFTQTYKNIANTYEKLRQFEQALQFAQKYIEQLKMHYSKEVAKLEDAEHWLKTIQTSVDIRK